MNTDAGPHIVRREIEPPTDAAFCRRAIHVDPMEALALEAREKPLQDHVHDRSSDAALRLDHEGRVLSSNGAARALFGAELERWPALGDRVTTDTFAAFLREVKARGHATTELEGVRAAGGSSLWLVLDGTALEGGFLVRTRDVSAVRALEAEVAHLRRTEALGLLTAGVAHDLHNLLTSVLSVTSVLQEERLDPGLAVPLLGEIQTAAERGRALTRQLLDLTRDRAASITAVDLRTTIRHLAPLLRRVLGEHVTLTLALADDLEPALLDPERLELALLNLAANARDALPRGGRVTLAAANALREREDAPREHVELTFRDDGIGMPAEVRARVLERFFTTKEPGLGTGLGLASVQRFASDSRGFLELDSEPGRGTTVTLWLPRAPRSERPTIPAVPQRASMPTDRNEGEAS